MRERVYPELVAREQIRAEEAERRIAILYAIVDDYIRQVQPNLFEFEEVEA